MDDEIAALERRIREGDETAWDALDAALLRAGRPSRRVWNVYSTRGEYADRTETTWQPYFTSKKDALAFMDRLARERDWERWERTENDESEPEYFCDDYGRMYLQPTEIVPPGGTALGRCGWRHATGGAECDRPAGHPQ
jgi:hypothetical protein